MSYTKTTWQNGDTITAEKLNHIEDGIADVEGGTLVVNSDYNSEVEGKVLDKTFEEIYEAFLNGVTVLLKETDNEDLTFESYGIVMFCSSTTADGRFSVAVASEAGQYSYTCSSQNAYPTFRY